ncbi:MAG: FecR family protein [Sphingobacteriaceae bacterium]
MNNEIIHLYRRYLNNQCTEQELKEIIDLIADGRHQPEWDFVLAEEENKVINGEFYEETDLKKTLNLNERILGTIKGKTGRSVQRKITLWPKFAAAMLVFALSAATYFYFNNTQNEEVIVETTELRYKNDVEPGGNKAVLTLADGKRIDLTNLKNGEVIEQSGIKITKTADGKLTYKITGDVQLNGADLAFNTIETPMGGQYQIQLPDGTKIWLNASSSLKFPASFTSITERKVELRGEAYFEVAHNKSSPFKVTTSNQVVEVLGTHFNVNAYTNEGAVKTTLLEGSVKVVGTSSPNSQMLKPGQQASLKTGKITVNQIDTELAVAWKNDLFMFEHDNIQYIMRMIERWYNVDVQYVGSIPDDKFGGAVSKFQNVSEVLKTLELTGKVHFKIEGRRIVVTK